MSDIDLTQEERKVLELLGKLHVSQSKNINEATIRKKLPSKYHKNLHEGKKIAERLATELFEKTYGDLRILLIL
jgi:hypothetical protein